MQAPTPCYFQGWAKLLLCRQETESQGASCRYLGSISSEPVSDFSTNCQNLLGVTMVWEQSPALCLAALRMKAQHQRATDKPKAIKTAHQLQDL